MDAPLDRIDLSLLLALEQQGRQSFRDLAEANGLSKTPCWNRVQRFEKAGMIRGYHADIDPTKLGLGFTAYVQVSIDAKERSAFEMAVLEDACITECLTTTGFADYILRILCADVSDLDNTLRYRVTLMPGVQKTTTMICMKVIKSRGSVIRAAQAKATDGGL